jgi:hypothetical protein
MIRDPEKIFRIPDPWGKKRAGSRIRNTENQVPVPVPCVTGIK